MSLGRHPFQSSTRPGVVQPSSTIQPSPSPTCRKATQHFPRRCQGHPKVVGTPHYNPLTVQLRKTVMNKPRPSIPMMQYRDLPEEAMAILCLDKALFNIITTIVKGSYLSLCIDLTGENARYTFAIIAMYKHACRTHRYRKQPQNGGGHDPEQ